MSPTAFILSRSLTCLWLGLGPPPAPAGLATTVPPPTAPPAPPTTNPVGTRSAPACRETAPTRAIPDVADLQRAALSRAPVDDRRVRGWQQRARASAALPNVSVGWDLRLDRGFDLDRVAGEADVFTADGLSANTFRVRATWQLDRLVFNPDELRAARAALDWLDWRAQLLDAVTRLHAEYMLAFSTRHRLVQEGSCGPQLDAIDAQLIELAGHLHALTGLQVW